MRDLACMCLQEVINIYKSLTTLTHAPKRRIWKRTHWLSKLHFRRKLFFLLTVYMWHVTRLERYYIQAICYEPSRFLSSKIEEIRPRPRLSVFFSRRGNEVRYNFLPVFPKLSESREVFFNDGRGRFLTVRSSFLFAIF